jgi:hypothetical protein
VGVPPPSDGGGGGGGELSSVADAVLSFAVICPLVATFWRGSWAILDALLPKEHVRTHKEQGCVGRRWFPRPVT